MNDLLDSIRFDAWVLHALILLPLAGAGLLLLLPARFTRPVALAITLVEALLALGLWWAFDPMQGMQLRFNTPWIEKYGIGYSIGIDGLSVFLVMLSRCSCRSASGRAGATSRSGSGGITRSSWCS